MACMMERSKVTPWLWMHASRVLIVPWAECSAPLVAMAWTRSLKSEGMQYSVWSFCIGVTARCLSMNPSLKKWCRCSHFAPSQLTLAASHIAPSPLKYILQQLLKSHPDLKSARAHTGATPLHLAVSRGRVGVWIVLCFFLWLWNLFGVFCEHYRFKACSPRACVEKVMKELMRNGANICSTVLVKTQNLVCASLFSVRSDLTRSRQSFILRTKLMRRSTACGLGRSIHQLAVCMCFL